MRFPWFGLALLGIVGGARADETSKTLVCLSPADMREVVSAKEVVAPVEAIRTARQTVPRADIVRANLCRRAEALVYVIVTLGRDGRVVQVVIDGSSGKVMP